MKTITFYSYKGGIGRSLALANLAHYLALNGHHVFALDLDLEAPGLHYKLMPRTMQHHPEKIAGGVVKYFEHWANHDNTPPDFEDGEFVYDATPDPSWSGSIRLMPAGNPIDDAYWDQLMSLDWREYFFDPDGEGIEVFLDLRAKIDQQFDPDYLLIDARTGITEVGSFASTILSDVVVLFLSNSNESVDGTARVIRAIRWASYPEKVTRLIDSLPLTDRGRIKLVPVVSRVPLIDRSYDEEVIGEIQAGLANRLGSTADANLTHPVVLHTDREIETREALRVAGTEPADSSRLLQDYLLLWRRIEEPVDLERGLLSNGKAVDEAVKDYKERMSTVRTILEVLNEHLDVPERLYKSLIAEWATTEEIPQDQLVDLNSLSHWEGYFPGLQEFWVVLPKFLAWKDPLFFDVMAHNLERQNTRYLYFLSEPIDVDRLRLLVARLSDKFGLGIGAKLRYVFVADKDFRAFLRYVNYWIVREFDKNEYTGEVKGEFPRGYRVFNDGKTIRGGIALEDGQVDDVIAFVKSVLGEEKLVGIPVLTRGDGGASPNTKQSQIQPFDSDRSG